MQKKKVHIAMVFTFLTIVALINKITHGIDPDEEMAIVNMYRLSLDPTHTVFTLNWDALQLVSTIFFPILYLFKFNNYDYLVIGIRLTTVLFQLLFVVYLSIFLRKCFRCSSFNTYLISCLMMLSYPKFIISLDHSNPIMWFYTIFVIEMYKYIYPMDNNGNENSKKNIHIYLSGLSYSLAVLSHPGNILILPIVFIYLLKKKNIKDFFKFLLPCFIAFIIFFLIFLKDNTLLFKDPMFFINGILSEGSHQGSFIQKINIRRIEIFLVMFVIALTINYLIKCINLKYIEDFHLYDILFVLYAIASIVSAIILKAPFAFQETFLFLLLLLFFNKNKNNHTNYFVNWGLLIVIILFNFSNKGLAEQINYLLPLIFILFVDSTNDYPKYKYYLFLTLSFFVLFIWIGYGCRVRSPYSSTILDNKHLNNSTLSFIKTEKEDFEYYNFDLSYLNNQNVLVVSKAPRLLIYPKYKTKILAPTSISTPKYDQQFIDYFNFINPSDIYLIVDQDSINYETKYKQFFDILTSNYNYQVIDTNNYFSVIYYSK